MRTKSHILDRSEKLIFQLPKAVQPMRQHQQLTLEVLIDIRDRLTFINSALQALNKQINDINKGGDTDEGKD